MTYLLDITSDRNAFYVMSLIALVVIVGAYAWTKYCQVGNEMPRWGEE